MVIIVVAYTTKSNHDQGLVGKSQTNEQATTTTTLTAEAITMRIDYTNTIKINEKHMTIDNNYNNKQYDNNDNRR